MKEVRRRLFYHADEVIAVVGSRLLVAFNLAGPDASKEMLYFWSPSVETCPKGLRREESTEDIIDSLLPSPAELHQAIRLTLLAKLWTVKADHISNLVEAKLLALDQRRKVSFGRGQSPWVTRASVVQFLTQRRIS